MPEVQGALGTWGLDTNVIARWVLADDAEQTAQVRAVFEQAHARGESFALGLPTILELEWVLRSRAKLGKASVLHVFKSLLEAQDLNIEHQPTVEQALYTYEHGIADFADCLFAAHYRQLGCAAMLTFDRQAGALAGAQSLLQRRGSASND